MTTLVQFSEIHLSELTIVKHFSKISIKIDNPFLVLVIQSTLSQKSTYSFCWKYFHSQSQIKVLANYSHCGIIILSNKNSIGM